MITKVKNSLNDIYTLYSVNFKFWLLSFPVVGFPFVLYIFCFFAETFNVSFKNVHDWSFKHYIVAALKSWSHNLSICIMSALASVDCLFLCELKFSWFLVC